MKLVIVAAVAVGCAAGPLPGPLPRSPDLPVLQEPTVQEHFEFLRDYKEVPLKDFDKAKAPQITRVTDIDDDTFNQYVRDGVPFVVDDCTRGFDEDSISNFECKDFSKRWPTGNMRAEYTAGQYHILLKDKTWHTKLEPTRSHREHMAGKKKIAGPYIWHVKDEEPLPTKRSVQKHWRTPYFMERSPTNRMEANESFEFWFSMAGGGTFTHADAYCESTISMQFRGKKRWRIKMFPETQHFLNASAFGDEEIYDAKTHATWNPETEFTVGPGQCFVFPIGYLHETYVDPADTDSGCYTASTYQFSHPRQVNHYRAYLSRLSMSHYGMTEPCLPGMESYATLLGKGRIKGQPDKAAALKKAQEIIKAIDVNNDGHIDQGEIHKHFCTTKKDRQKVINQGGFLYNWHDLQSKEQKQIQEEDSLKVWSEDALQYHDMNRDKTVTAEELAHGLLQWHVVNSRMGKVKNANNIKNPTKWLKKVLPAEKQVISKFYCQDEKNCPLLDEVTKYGEQLPNLKQELKIARANVGRMFEGEERQGDSEQLTFKDRDSGKTEAKVVRDIKNEL